MSSDTDDIPPENRALAQAAAHAGQLALHPGDRDPRGIYESGENLWVSPFSRAHRLKCRLIGHRTETMPLLSIDGEQIGEIEWCRVCTSVIQRRQED